jgi:hypothetical protein
MSELLQWSLVAVAVVACAGFSAWRLMSLSLRLKLLGMLVRVPLLAHGRSLARLRQTTLAGSGTCGGCAQAGTHAVTPGAASPNRTPGALRR